MPLTWKYMSSARKRSMKVATPTEEKAARKPNKDKRRYSDSEKEKKHIFFLPWKVATTLFPTRVSHCVGRPRRPGEPRGRRRHGQHAVRQRQRRQDDEVEEGGVVLVPHAGVQEGAVVVHALDAAAAPAAVVGAGGLVARAVAAKVKQLNLPVREEQ